MTRPGDLLLEYITTQRVGSFVTLRETLFWFMAGRQGVDLKALAPWKWMREMQALGHFDVDWDKGVWAIAPTTLTGLPASDGLFLVAGARGKHLMDRIDALESALSVSYGRPNTELSGGFPLPWTLYLASGHDSGTPSRPQDLARLLSDSSSVVRATNMAAADIAFEGLPSIRNPATLSGGPTIHSALEVLDQGSITEEDATWIVWKSAEFDPEGQPDGLYRWRTPQLRHGLALDGQWFDVDREEGIWRLLASMGDTSRIKLRVAQGSESSAVGELLIPKSFPLPPPQRRAATLCSGLPAKIGFISETYLNVPRGIAEAIASSLGQSLRQLP